MRRVRLQGIIYTLSVLYSANGSLGACTLGSFDCPKPPRTCTSTNKQPLPSTFEQNATNLLLNFVDNDARTQKTTRAPVNQLLCTAEQILQQADDETPNILSCTEGIKFEHRQPRKPHAQCRGRIKNNKKPQSASSSSDSLHDLWLEAADNPLWGNAQEGQTASPLNHSEPSPEEVATQRLIQSSVALLIFKKNELDAVGAHSFELKERLWADRAQIKNDLLVYFMSIDRLEPCLHTPHRPAYGYREATHHYSSAYSSMTEQNRPASPTPESSLDTKQGEGPASQLKRSESSKSLSDHKRSNACFGDNRL